jgi:hypothetical protein
MSGAWGGGHFARKLSYRAIIKAVARWSRCRGSTSALLAFRIHFEDRLPD